MNNQKKTCWVCQKEVIQGKEIKLLNIISRQQAFAHQECKGELLECQTCQRMIIRKNARQGINGSFFHPFNCLVDFY